MTPALLLLAPLWASLLACGVRSDWNAPDAADAIFPHPDGFEQGVGHGPVVLARGLPACTSCHALEDEGGATGQPATTGEPAEGTPSCASCHPAWPHPEGYADGALHGEGTWGPEGSREACEACHGDPALFAGSTLACTACHDTWPHPDGWAEAGQHGQVVLARGSAEAACGACHGGAALDGGRVGGACTTCHESWPHPEGWSDGAVHGAWPDASAPWGGEACSGCHGQEDGGTAEVACSRCHAGFPHPEGWSVGHIPLSGVLGEGACLRCHEAGDGPSGMVATCAASCHGGAR